MDFSYTSEEEQFRHEVRSWLEANVPADLRAGKDDDLSVDERWERRKDWHKKLHAGGWIGLWWPQEYGGGGRRSVNRRFSTKSWRAPRCPVGST